MSEQHVKVNVSADTAGLSAGLAKAQRSVNEFKEAASESFKDVAKDFAGMFAAGVVLEGLHSVFEEFDRIGKLAERFGETAETMQRVGQAADLAGTDVETVAKGMKSIDVAAVQAMRGSKELAEAFSDLGINAGEFVDLPMEEKLEKLSEGYQNNSTDALKLASITKVLSKAGPEMVDLLKQGPEELKKTFESVTVASNDTVEKIEEADETFKNLWNHIKVLGADAIGVIVVAAQGLYGMLRFIGAYLENLPHGLKAAREAAEVELNAQRQAITDAENKKAAQADQDKGKKGKTAGIIAQQHAQEEADKQGKEDAKELAELEKDNAKKKAELQEKALSLAAREFELKQKIAGLEKEQIFKGGSKLEVAKRESSKLDLQRELAATQKEIQEANDKQADKDKESAKAKAREKARAEIEAKKSELERSETNLSKLEKADKSFDVDSLRKIGGGIGGVNYKSIDSKEALQKQGIELAKQQVEQLKAVVKALEDKARTLPSSNGAFGA